MTKLDDHGQPDPAINVERRIQRDVSEMLGFARGVIADGVVSEDEAFALMNWADAHEDLVLAWPGNVFYRRLRKIFNDGPASEVDRERPR